LAFYGCDSQRDSRLEDRDPDETSVDTNGQLPPAVDDPRPAILFLGNSLTAGLGVDLADAFPSVVQTKIDQSRLEFRVINAGISGETTGGGLSRLEWLLETEIVALVLELGANDGLRGAPPEIVEENLQAIIDGTRERHPGIPIVLAGMRAPPNMGRTYTEAFQDVFPRLAIENGIGLIPFLLEGVAAERRLTQADGIHPNAEGHAILAETVWEALHPVLAGLSEVDNRVRE